GDRSRGRRAGVDVPGHRAGHPGGGARAAVRAVRDRAQGRHGPGPGDRQEDHRRPPRHDPSGHRTLRNDVRDPHARLARHRRRLTMLALRGIVRTFGRRRAVADVSFEVAAGEAVLLVGENGAGKTTLLRIATGFLDPDAGEVIVAGIAMAGERARAQGRLGYLPEQAPAPSELTVRA